MKILLNLLLLISSFVFTSCKKDSTNNTPKTLSILGADISYLPEIRKTNFTVYNQINQAEDMLITLKNTGVNTIRLRLWHSPKEFTSNFSTVKNLCNEIKAMGLKTLISVHYSDDWADPSKQVKPNAWQGLSFNQLYDSVYQYTKKIAQEIKPDYIQIGNEINNGFVFPEGNITNLTNFKTLVKNGCKAVRDISTTTKIIIHYAGIDGAANFYNNIKDVDFDIIGLSYYPMWHGKSLDNLQTQMEILNTTFQKQIAVVETAYPFTLNWNDWTNNIVGLSSQLITGYDATAIGQKDFLNSLKQKLLETNGAIGFCYWGAEWISYKGNQATNGSSWENQAFWDFNNQALPVMDVYKN